MRLFVGLPLDDEARRGVEKVRKVLFKKHWAVRWVPEENWHVTAAFVGDTNNVDGVCLAVERVVVEMESFEVGFKGLGAWPDLLLPKTIWLGVNGDLKRMHGLVKEIRNQLELEEVEFDRQVFRPHVTLGRAKRECGRKERLEIGRQIMKLRVLNIPQKWRVDKVVVYETQLGKEGVVYSPLKTVGFE